MHASIQYGPVFGFEDLVTVVIGLIIFIIIISVVETGVMVALKWGKLRKSLRVSFGMNVASTILGIGGVLAGTWGLDKFPLWLTIALAFFLSVLIEGGILMLTKRDTPYLNWMVSLTANGTSYLFVVLPLARMS